MTHGYEYFLGFEFEDLDLDYDIVNTPYEYEYDALEIDGYDDDLYWVDYECGI